MAESKSKIRGLTAERVNLVIAGCAILISGASFYATFLQADAAERQVKAMTMPLIQFDHGNHDPDLDRRAVVFSLDNAGVGPAVIKSVELGYRDKTYDDIYEFFNACCADEYAVYQDYEAELGDREWSALDGATMTQPLAGVILPGQSDYEFFKMYFHKSNSKFCGKLNQERGNLKLSVCYCSLLDDCFLTKDGSVITEIESCPVI